MLDAPPSRNIRVEALAKAHDELPLKLGSDNQTPVALGIGYGPTETKFTGKIHKIVVDEQRGAPAADTGRSDYINRMITRCRPRSRAGGGLIPTSVSATSAPKRILFEMAVGPTDVPRREIEPTCVMATCIA